MILRIFSYTLVAFSIFTMEAYAAEDPFKEGTELITSITGSLTGDIAAAFLTLVIIVMGYAWWMGKVSREWALKIIGGCLLIGCAGGISAMLFGG